MMFTAALVLVFMGVFSLVVLMTQEGEDEA